MAIRILELHDGGGYETDHPLGDPNITASKSRSGVRTTVIVARSPTR
ncbi:hypothetical protein [Dokdonella sp.]